MYWSLTLKYSGTSYVLVPHPHFYYQIYFDWLVHPTYKIVPAPLLVKHSLSQGILSRGHEPHVERGFRSKRRVFVDANITTTVRV